MDNSISAGNKNGYISENNLQINKKSTKIIRKNNFLKRLNDNKYLILLFLPGFIVFFIFKYLPLGGIIMAFQDYNFTDGIINSPFVGFTQFENLFRTNGFILSLKNTLKISVLHLIFGFPAPVILAILLNEIKNVRFKKLTQTITYLPHFFSWVVLTGLLTVFLAPTNGIVNQIIKGMGGRSIYFLADKTWFVPVLIISSIWKEVGWGSIIYLAALTSISPELYEAATIDGATKLQKTAYITLPGLASTISVMLILKMGHILDAGFDQIFNMYNPAVYDVSDIIDTYVYRMGIGSFEYSFATAASLFKSTVALVMVVSTNYISKKLSQGENSVW